VRLADLISADLLPAGSTLLPAQGATDEVATVLPDGKIAYDGEIYNTPSAASGAASGASTNGWTYWTADTPDGQFSLAAIRDEFLARRQWPGNSGALTERLQLHNHPDRPRLNHEHSISPDEAPCPVTSRGKSRLPLHDPYPPG
jgi:hypothetical protein